ncbi:winged helix-turn-helix domain-containing protein [uncultured Methanobrevibacter sp.]|uniref:winged helix-turn-helix domain-containing protein n=1 Tax=uncultured Methanobrevibacter sp. TaxID=253161 RepID=UPI0025DB7047|nr:winged helix-turn-helix domain-containing protein [uncultured Methanobrevibacter sp.]
MDNEMLGLVAYVKISSYRLKTVMSLYDSDKTPSQIAKDTGIRINHISTVLKKLKELGIVVCLNEDDKRNRIYQLTPVGRRVVDCFDLI